MFRHRMEDLEGDIIVPYHISGSLNPFVRRIENAMQKIEDCSRVRFIGKSYDDGKSLLITSTDGCYFSPCRRNLHGTCRPTVSIGEGCRDHGTMLHELLHALGFQHEHQRPDRNQYLKIYWENIEQGEKVQFKKLSKNQFVWNIDDFRFDYASVMLYGEDFFSKNGYKTMEAKNGRPLRDKKTQLSRLDKDKLDSL